MRISTVALIVKSALPKRAASFLAFQVSTVTALPITSFKDEHYYRGFMLKAYTTSYGTPLESGHIINVPESIDILPVKVIPIPVFILPAKPEHGRCDLLVRVLKPKKKFCTQAQRDYYYAVWCVQGIRQFGYFEELEFSFMGRQTFSLTKEEGLLLPSYRSALQSGY